jgi:serine/threonine-protein kinase
MLDQIQPTLLPGTENGQDAFFSPDGQWIGFFTSNQLKKVPVQGGIPERLCSAQTNSRGGSWGPAGTLIASLQQLGGLSRVPDSGGEAKYVTGMEAGIVSHRWPQVLPAGDAALFTASHSIVDMDNASIEAVSLKTGQIKVLVRGGYFGRYLPSGHLVYIHQGALYGVPFDAARLEVRGTPAPLVQDIGANPATGGGQFDISGPASGGGTLVYLPGKGGVQHWGIASVDSSGKLQPLITEPGAYTLLRFSPDGRKLAFVAGAGVFVYDLERGTTNQLTFGGGVTPVWAPDGKHLVLRDNSGSITWMRADGSGEPQHLMDASANHTNWSFSPDGKWLALFQNSAATGFDIWILPLDLTDPEHPKPGKPEPFLQTPADELVPRFSPDGRWIAYRSNESGGNEIWVRPFPASRGGKWQISNGGGIYGLWSNNGHELFYETEDNRIMAMDYRVEGDTFVPGKRRLWYEGQVFYPGNSNLDITPDGKRFAVLTTPEGARETKGSVHVTMLLNFFDDLKRRMPVK